MVPPIALLALRVGFVTLLWIFVLAVLLALRSDLFGVRPVRAPTVRRERAPQAPAAPKRKRGGGGIPRLVVTEGALAGTTMTLGDAPITIGRADNSTLVLTDDFVSGHHARVFPQQGQWWVEDLGSTNGTVLDRTRLTEPLQLHPGAQIRIGKTVLELRS